MILKKLFKKEYYYLFNYQVLIGEKFIDGEMVYKLPARNEKKVDIDFVRYDIKQMIESRNQQNVDCVIITNYKKINWR